MSPPDHADLIDAPAPTGPTTSATPQRLLVRSLLVGERIDTAGFEKDVISTSPLALKVKDGKIAILFRYGVVVFMGLDGDEQRVFLRSLSLRIQGSRRTQEEETIAIEPAVDHKDAVRPGGPICVSSFSLDRLLLIADALAKSTLLAHTEQIVGSVFDVMDPYARTLAESGRTPRNRTAMLRIIGNALLVHQQVSGKVAILEKPDALWDKPELERLYERLADEFELTDRVEALQRKLTLITETASVMTDLIDTRRSLRLEVAVVALIVLEVVMSVFQIGFG